MGLRGPKPVSVGLLKTFAVQWSYLLFGVRDGYPDLLQALTWGPWVEKGGMQVRAAISEQIIFGRIIPDGRGSETASLVFEILRMYATRKSTDEPPTVEYPLFQKLQRDIVLPEAFGLELQERGYMVFPAFPPQPHLWEKIKRARSVKELRRATQEMYEGLTAVVPGIAQIGEFQGTLHDGAGELFKARDLWNYPRNRRASSDNKRIEFFAESLAGLMLGLSPATATRKLSRWTPPKLWLTRFEDSSPLS